MKTLGLILLLILTQTCLAQFKMTKLNKNSIPKSIQYKDHLFQAVRWTDKAGDNIVILASTFRKPFKTTDPMNETFFDAELQAGHYIVLGDSVKQTWTVREAGSCPGDFYLYFIDKTFAITDLNKDGNAEVWIMYKADCGGTYPVRTKIVMYDGIQKYELQGESQVKTASSEYVGGTFTLDDNFKNGQIVFRQYAEKLWLQNKFEK